MSRRSGPSLFDPNSGTGLKGSITECRIDLRDYGRWVVCYTVDHSCYKHMVCKVSHTAAFSIPNTPMFPASSDRSCRLLLFSRACCSDPMMHSFVLSLRIGKTQQRLPMIHVE